MKTRFEIWNKFSRGRIFGIPPLQKASKFPLSLVTFRSNLVYTILILHNQSHANLHMNFSLQNGGYNQAPPSWSQSYTPVGGGCYNRCKPKCSFRPPPPPPMPMPPRPRPRPIPMPAPRPQPMPLPQPARPNYGCRTACRPMCNAKPSCGGGAQMNGNTMMCNSQSR